MQRQPIPRARLSTGLEATQVATLRTLQHRIGSVPDRDPTAHNGETITIRNESRPVTSLHVKMLNFYESSLCETRVGKGLPSSKTKKSRSL